MQSEYSKSDKLYDVLLGSQTEERIRKIAIGAAIVGFVSHIVIWALHYTQNNPDKRKVFRTGSISIIYSLYSVLILLPTKFTS